jgi:DNA-directed RNA polymerase, mitochondrial
MTDAVQVEQGEQYGPVTIERVQEELEREMIRVGIERFERSTTNLEEAGMASKTSYGMSFIRTVLLDCAAAIRERMGAAKTGAIKYGKNWHLIAEIEPESAAFITLREVIDQSSRKGSLSDIVRSIGRKVEDEIRFRRFESQDKDRLDRVLKRLKDNGTLDYRHKHRVITHNITHDTHGNANGALLYEWSLAEAVHVGSALLDVIISTAEHFQKVTINGEKRRQNILEMSPELLTWISEHKDKMGLLYPAFLPCIIEPMDWDRAADGRYFGGYYTPEAQASLPMIINKGKNGKKALEALKDADLSRVCEAINHLQKTRWKVNTRVLDAVQEVARCSLGIGMPQTEKFETPSFPFHEEWKKEEASEQELQEFAEWKHVAAITHTAERERVSKAILLSRIITTAERFRHYREMYFVWHCDFRGRMYTAASGLSPQSNDVAKGLLHFAEGKQLDSEQAVFWWKVHGANCFGVDKLSYQERVKWVDENEQYILEAAHDPIASRGFWGGTDKPYQFLAWCFEFEAFRRLGRAFSSHIPIGLDGSCNGLQHFSAMLRDSVGGAAVNLTPSAKPNDIYAEVAKRATQRLSAINDEHANIARAWIDFGINRSMVKRPVMTLPYGSTRASCREYLFTYLIETDRGYFGSSNAPKFFNLDGSPITSSAAINLLTDVVWESIGDVVIAARDAMDWLRKAAGIVSKANMPITFTAPSGFVVYQAIKKVNVKIVKTLLCGRTAIFIGEPDEDKIDGQRQRNGISPNFVHSCDASHLVATVLKSKQAGLSSISAIHDDYGVHAADTALFHNLIRECFVDQYSVDVLQRFKDEVESRTGLALPNLPAFGGLNLQEVIDSGYFFG